MRNFRLSHLTMQNWKTAFLTLVIFALGSLAGTLVTARILKERMEQHAGTIEQPIVPDVPFQQSKNPWPTRTLEGMARMIKPTTEQRVKIGKILHDVHEGNRKLRDDMQNLATQADREILEILTPEQKPEYEKYLNKRKSLAGQKKKS